MKASAKRRRNKARLNIKRHSPEQFKAFDESLSGDQLERIDVATRKYVRFFFNGKLHPKRRRPLHALRGRALRRRVAHMRYEGAWRLARQTHPGPENTEAREDMHAALLEQWSGTPRQIRSAARARRFACADRKTS